MKKEYNSTLTKKKKSILLNSQLLKKLILKILINILII